ncbi:helix-turn-helix transcriptional regulator [Streptomyces sp. ISID311]|uniref:helix-turn-helix domain-containing protein n=1 Tax=Streptomyces sp. ISID311 TaxID=2601673 RepID=UPI0011BD3824|nr:helix-turn-helix transcriptional regulator [Streptomyces sp. ISID311]TXC99113.1 helix-turn-helix transcriptional regulator [Streptomyces sp. ISID311]
MANASRQAAWEFWGTELKRRRKDAGLTQEALGGMVFVSGCYIGQFEQAIRKPQLDVAIRIDGVLQTDGFFERMWRRLIGASPFESYFAAVAELEALATKICEFESLLIPGLLQTPGYAREVMVSATPLISEEELDEKVSARLERAQIFKGPAKPQYWAIIHEAALRVPVGGAAQMAEQLDHLVALVRSRRVMLQVIPYAQGAHAAMSHSMKLMEFADTPPTAYTEGLFWGQLLDDPAMVKRATATYDLLRAAALSPKASLSLIESAAESYRSS